MEVSPIRKAAVRPKVSVMVNTAIMTLAEPKGSSLQAINKYISENYNADVQKLSVYIKKHLKSSVENGEIVQSTGKGARGSFKMNKQKIAKPRASKKKLPQTPKMRTSTPEKTSKLKETFTPEKNSVKEIKSTDDEEVPPDSTFTKSDMKTDRKPSGSISIKSKKLYVSQPSKVRNRKKITKKSEEPDTSISSTRKVENEVISSKRVKTQGLPNSVEVKVSTPEKSAETKTNYSDDAEISVDSTFTTPKAKITKKSNMSPLAKVKNTKKLLAKKAQKFNSSLARREKLKNTMFSSKRVKTEGTPKSSKYKKFSTPEKSPEIKMIVADDKEVSADSIFTISDMRKLRKSKVPILTKTKKSNVFLPSKIKTTQKLIAKVLEGLDTSVSSEKKLESAMVSSKQGKGTSKSAEVSPENNFETKMSFKDDDEVLDDSTFIILKMKIANKSNVSLLSEVEKFKKLIEKEIEESYISIPSKEKFENTMVSSKPVKFEGTTKSTEVKKVSTPEKSPEAEMNFTDNQEVSTDSSFIISKMKKIKKPRVSIPTKTRKSKISLERKRKVSKKLIAKDVAESNASESPKKKLNNIAASSNHEKTKGTSLRKPRKR